eukprot:symbB.v1.2.024204.t2/scaffold2244.1/size113925/3
MTAGVQHVLSPGRLVISVAGIESARSLEDLDVKEDCVTFLANGERVFWTFAKGLRVLYRSKQLETGYRAADQNETLPTPLRESSQAVKFRLGLAVKWALQKLELLEIPECSGFQRFKAEVGLAELAFYGLRICRLGTPNAVWRQVQEAENGLAEALQHRAAGEEPSEVFTTVRKVLKRVAGAVSDRSLELEDPPLLGHPSQVGNGPVTLVAHRWTLRCGRSLGPGIGTWKLSPEEAEKTVAAALNEGVRHVDTAAEYCTEEAVARGIRSAGVSRDDVFVNLKVAAESDEELRKVIDASMEKWGPLSILRLVMPGWSSAHTASLLAVSSVSFLALATLLRRRGEAREALLAKSSYAAEVRVAVRLALQCGKAMRDCLQKKVDWKDQSSIDPVTQTDKDNEELVIAGLRAAFPSHEIIGEESTAARAAQGLPRAMLTDSPTWIVDPIDGTTNFVYGIKLSCVSLGFCVGREPVVGVVYDPYADELFMAAKGEGAYLNGTRLCVHPVQSLKESMVLFELGYERSQEGLQLILNGLRTLLLSGARATRTIGTAVLSLCWGLWQTPHLPVKMPEGLQGHLSLEDYEQVKGTLEEQLRKNANVRRSSLLKYFPLFVIFAFGFLVLFVLGFTTSFPTSLWLFLGGGVVGLCCTVPFGVAVLHAVTVPLSRCAWPDFGSETFDKLHRQYPTLRWDYCKDGRLSGEGGKPWDYAAGTIIAKEAGAKFCNLQGAAFDIEGPSHESVDCLMLHRAPENDKTLEKLWAVLEDEVKRGRAKMLGASNITASQLQVLTSHRDESLWPAVVQLKCSIFHQGGYFIDNPSALWKTLQTKGIVPVGISLFNPLHSCVSPLEEPLCNAWAQDLACSPAELLAHWACAMGVCPLLRCSPRHASCFSSTVHLPRPMVAALTSLSNLTETSFCPSMRELLDLRSRSQRRSVKRGDHLTGQQVEVHSLKSADGQKLNGKLGLLMDFEEDTGRWQVALPEGVRKIRPEHLSTVLVPLQDDLDPAERSGRFLKDLFAAGNAEAMMSLLRQRKDEVDWALLETVSANLSFAESKGYGVKQQVLGRLLNEVKQVLASREPIPRTVLLPPPSLDATASWQGSSQEAEKLLTAVSAVLDSQGFAICDNFASAVAVQDLADELASYDRDFETAKIWVGKQARHMVGKHGRIWLGKRSW